MGYDVFQHEQGAKWWFVDTVDASSAEDAILVAAQKSHGDRRGKWHAYENVHECAEMELR